MPRHLLTLLCALALGCGDADPPPVAQPADEGATHVHGLGVNPSDGALFIATHTGLFRGRRGRDHGEPRR